MPQKPKVNTEPGPGILQRMFGGPISESTQTEWPELASQWASQEIHNPAQTNMTSSVRPMNWYEKFATGGEADAITWPWGTIAMNRGAIEKNKQDVGDVLTHELTHVGQNPGLMGSLRNRISNSDKGYYERPEEKEAFAAEYARIKPHDRNLPLDTSPSTSSLQKLVHSNPSIAAPKPVPTTFNVIKKKKSLLDYLRPSPDYREPPSAISGVRG